ncbi:uncharacterized protein [Hoplias malabaricus]|uniref:uncharacterized protein n=1 Tax=Hoplias malabaricus TaxID=27720 RepID=UPI0034626609
MNMAMSALVLALTFLASAHADSQVKGLTDPEVFSHHGDDVILYCNISTHHETFDSLKIDWLRGQEILCSHSDPYSVGFHTHSGHFCHYTPLKHLTLTIPRASPEHKGHYFCKLKSNHGHSIANTTLEISDVPRTDTLNVSETTDSFTGAVRNRASASPNNQGLLILLFAHSFFYLLLKYKQILDTIPSLYCWNMSHKVALMETHG